MGIGINGFNRGMTPRMNSQFSRQNRANNNMYGLSSRHVNNNNRPTIVSVEQNPDGSTTQYMSNGLSITSDGKTYGIIRNSSGQITSEWTQKDGTRIGKDYDQDGRVTCLHEELENENGETVSETFTNYMYDDNGKVTNERVYNALRGEETSVKYDENGVQTEKFVRQGAVTTYFDADDKPIKRETHKGQGIVVTEDLTE